MVFLAALPISETLSWLLGVSVPIFLMVLANLLSPVIELTDSNLKVGRMTLPISVLGAAEVFEGEAARAQRGPDLSPGSQILFRGDIDKLVKIQIIDPADPTDFVVFSSRRAEALAIALGADRA